MIWWVQAFLGIVFETKRFQTDLAHSQVEVISLAKLLAVSISNSGHWERETAAKNEADAQREAGTRETGRGPPGPLVCHNPALRPSPRMAASLPYTAEAIFQIFITKQDKTKKNSLC